MLPSRLAHRMVARTAVQPSRAMSNIKQVAGMEARVCAVLGGQWGDEGKGKLADVLAKNYDVVGRFNGGNNAGHTVVVDGKKYAFHLLPCGLIYPHTQNILGNGTVVHVDSLFKELEPLDADGLEWRGRLKISNRAHILFDFHQQIDGMNEDRLAPDKKIGTTKKGIGPCYTSKMMRLGMRFGELEHWETFEPRFREVVEAHQRMHHFDCDVEAELEKYKAHAATLKEQGMIVDGVHFVNDMYNQGKSIITEGANAVMLDMDYGTYPFVTSSTTTVGGIATGLGLAPQKIDCAMGVVKAYTTRVGWGPFPTELTDDLCGGMVPRGAPGTDIGRHMQEVGAEIGVTTGRKRRCGWLDMVVVQYSMQMQQYSSINVTKLDVLDELDEIRIGIAYEIDGQRLPVGVMPSTLDGLEKVKVIYETMPGWKQSIAHCRTFEELPEAAQNYVNRMEELAGCPVTWIGVGVGRLDMATKGFSV